MMTKTIEQYQETAQKILINSSSNDYIKDFVDICRMSQEDLKQFLTEWAKINCRSENVIEGDGFILVKGDDPVLLTAHMDTVHKELVQMVYEFGMESGKTIITSPQGIGGDDRCGIYMILRIILAGYKPYVLFCEDEEIGGVGSNKFIKTEYAKEISDLKFYIELDRANDDDAVYYNCDNNKFHKFIEEITGYKKAYGSFSDISHLSPETDVASVNLSCGYYKAHTTDEYVVFEEMENTIEKVKDLLDAAESEEVEKYDYQPVKVKSFFSRDYYDNYNFWDDDDTYSSKKSKINSGFRKSYAFLEDVPTQYTGYFYYLDEDEMECEEQVTGDSKLACIAKFLMMTGVSWNDVLDYCFDFD